METFWESSREDAMKIINFKNKKMLPLSNKLPHQQKKFEHKYTNDKNYCKFKDHCDYSGKYKGTAHSICNLKYTISK